MSQVPLAPPPPTGGPLDSWLYLLWRRLTQAGQILWASIAPGTSADVAAVVTDETGSPGSLVFSANPTLQGLTVESGSILGGDTTARTLGGSVPTYQFSGTGAAAFLSVMRYTPGGGGASIALAASRGTAGTNSALAANDGLGTLIVYGDDGSSIINNVGYIRFGVDGAVSTGVIPSRITFVVMDSTGANFEVFRGASNGTVTLAGSSSFPALKVIPVASPARWIEVTGATSTGNPQLATTAGELLLPQTIVLPKTSGKGIQVDTDSPSFGWRDIIGQIGVKTTGATDPVWTLYRGSMYAYTFDTATAEAFMVFHIPHDYVPSSDMYVHVHWSQNVVDTGGTAGVPGVAEWKFDISYADGHGTAGGAADPFVAPITVTVTQQASTTQYGHMIAEVQFTNSGGTGGLLDSATIQVDGLILVRLYRVKANPADTLNQAPFVHTADVHYRSSNIGTKQKEPISTGSFYV